MKPFTMKAIKTPFFGKPTFRILFEGERYSTCTVSIEVMKNIVNLLNIAYNLGKGEIK